VRSGWCEPFVTVVVPLGDDPSVAELEEGRDMGPQGVPGGQVAQGDGERPGPGRLKGDVVPGGEGADYFEALRAQGCVARVGRSLGLLRRGPGLVPGLGLRPLAAAEAGPGPGAGLRAEAAEGAGAGPGLRPGPGWD